MKPKVEHVSPKKADFDDNSRDSLGSVASTASTNDETLAILTAAQPDDCDFAPVRPIDPAVVEFYIERTGGKKTIDEIDTSPNRDEKRPELTLLAKAASFELDILWKLN